MQPVTFISSRWAFNCASSVSQCAPLNIYIFTVILTNALIFLATVEENAPEHCLMIIGLSCLSSDAIIFGLNSDYSLRFY